MYKEIEVTSIGLIIWQVILLALIILIIYLIIKFYKLGSVYLKLKIEYLKKLMDKE